MHRQHRKGTGSLAAGHSRLCIPQEFPRNSPGISQGLQEIDFDIWGIWAFPVHSPGTNIKRSTDGKGTSKNLFCFHMEQVFALLLLASA
jgi:hypothetical protein